jgi:Rrf2 family iron-sulfur cluster assembly transcriptional regulator
MKFTAQEEYGLRCLLQIGRHAGGGLTIPEIAVAEGLSTPYVAKLMRVLRRGGFVKSTRGQTGGYTLARPTEQIVVGEVLSLLGGRFFETEFCERYPGSVQICTHTVDCSIRSLWHAVQDVVDQVLGKTTLRDLLVNEQEMSASVSGLVRLGGSQPKELPCNLEA